MRRRIVPIVCCLLACGQLPLAMAAEQPELNFKIYSPSAASSASKSASETPAASKTESSDSMWTTETSAPSPSQSSSSASATSTAPAAGAETPEVAPVTTDTAPAATTSTDTPTDTPVPAASGGEEKKVLQGYIRVVPSGTKIPIIMDTAVDSDTSQEGDEFAARTGEDLNIDGNTVVPAGSIIKGRIAQLNAPKSLSRSGSVALKFDTVTTPDNRQIPLVANLVARGGVVHAKRGLKDIAMDTGTFMAPSVLGLGIGVLAGGAQGGGNKVGRGGGALIGAGVGAAVGIAILCIKKGKKVDVRPGDELKIELGEDLRMPM